MLQSYANDVVRRPDALQYALNQTEAKVVFTNARNVRKLMKNTALLSLETIIYTDTLADVPEGTGRKGWPC